MINKIARWLNSDIAVLISIPIAISMLTLMSETDCLGWERGAADALNEIERKVK